MTKNRFKFLFWLLIGILVFILLYLPLGPLPPLAPFFSPVGGFWETARQAQVPPNETLHLRGLHKPVTILLDERAVPHVYAQTDEDAYFAQGYLHARNRLFRMVFQDRLVEGTLSKIVGPQAVSTDRFMRQLDLKTPSQRALQLLKRDHPKSYASLRAYTAGVNAYLTHLTDRTLPLEFKLLNFRPQKWTALKSLMFLRYMGWDLSGSDEDLKYEELVRYLGAKKARELFPYHLPYVVPIIPEKYGMPADIYRRLFPHGVQKPIGFSPAPQTAAQNFLTWWAESNPHLFGAPGASRGSNNWVIDGIKSGTGHPILANDPHLAIWLPSVWYEIHLSTPTMNVYGVSLQGVPGVIIGFTDQIAWGLTNEQSDVTDFFRLKFKDKTRDAYWYRGAWKSVQKIPSVIKVRGGKDVPVTTRWTVHGPIVEKDSVALALKWTGHRPTLEMVSLYHLNHAKNYADYVEAMKYFHVPAQNVVYADVDGNIAMWCAGLYPIRNHGDGRVPVDGSTDRFEWGAFVPFEATPHTKNPKQHFISSANQRPISNDYPYYMGFHWNPGYRSRRIHQLLSTHDSITVAEMQRFQNDVGSFAAARFVPVFVRVLKTHARQDSAYTTFLNIFQNWDYRMDSTKVAPTLWSDVMNRYRNLIFQDDFKKAGHANLWKPEWEVVEQLTLEKPDSPWFDDVLTPARERRDDILLLAVRETYRYFRGKYGNDPANWVYGKHHKFEIRHMLRLPALGLKPFAIDGSGFTLRPAGGHIAHSGASWRMVVELKKPIQAYGVYPGGQSGNPVSAFYTTGVANWRFARYFKLHSENSPEKLSAQKILSRMTCVPKK